jgi:hypothetical protein
MPPESKEGDTEMMKDIPGGTPSLQCDDRDCQTGGVARGRRRVTGMGLVFWFLLSCAVLPIGLPVAGFAEEAFKRHITVYGNSPLLDKYPTDIAKNYNLVITEWWKSSSVGKVKEINPDVEVIFYRDLNGMLTSYDDWAEASKHSAWFVRDAVTNKRLVHKAFGWYLMDITNPEFSRHLSEYLQQKLVAYPVFDGVFLDDVQANIAHGNFVIEGTETPGTFSSVYLQLYRPAVSSFLQGLKAALVVKLVIINSDDHTQYIQYVDGIMLEGFVHGSWQTVDYYKDGVSWLADMQTLANFLKLNKLVLVHSGSQGSGDALQKQFLFCFASFLLLCNQNTYFFFDTPMSSTPLPPFPQYTRSFGPALESLPSSSFAAMVVQRPMSSTMEGWAATSGVTVVQADGSSALQFVSDGPNGAYATRCIDLSASNRGVLSISCSAKGLNVSAGSVSWMRFALDGKFYDASNNLLQAGADLLFDLGTYDWKAYNISYQLPPSTNRYCVSALGFFPSSLGTGWVKDLQINSVVPVSQRFNRAFQQATVFVDLTNTTGIIGQPTFRSPTGLTIIK